MSELPDIYPVYRFQNGRAGIDQLKAAFGFETHVEYGEGEAVHHGELRLGNGFVMVAGAGEPDPTNPERRTRCVIAGEFVVHGDKIPAVPKFIGLKIAPKLESIILGYMIPNFRSLASGIGSYLDAKKARVAAGDVAAG